MTDDIAEIICEQGPEDFQGVGAGLWATTLSNGYFVSTVKLGEITKQADKMITSLMNLYGVTATDLGRPANLDMKGDYETMVFTHDGEHRDSKEVAFARYTTEEEAREGHIEMVERWRRM